VRGTGFRGRTDSRVLDLTDPIRELILEKNRHPSPQTARKRGMSSARSAIDRVRGWVGQIQQTLNRRSVREPCPALNATLSLVEFEPPPLIDPSRKAGERRPYNMCAMIANVRRAWRDAVDRERIELDPMW